MKTSQSSGQAWAFSLLELLSVVVIIGIMASILLPVLIQGRERAKRIQCVSQLRQAGLAFHSFALEHNNQFPMTVTRSAGGSLEFVQDGYRLEGEFYFGYRHFQALSNELVAARLVVCPADTRLPAASFTGLRNENLSYFVGVNAQFGRSDSILAGDRNLTNDWIAPATVQRLGPNHMLRWTRELHRFKGNLLFADAHVEERNSPGLLPAPGQLPGLADFVMPTAGATASVADRMPASTGSDDSINTPRALEPVQIVWPPLSWPPWAPVLTNWVVPTSTARGQPPSPSAPEIQNPEVRPKANLSNVTPTVRPPRPQLTNGLPASVTTPPTAPRAPGLASASPKLCYLTLLLLLLLLVLLGLLVGLALRRQFRRRCDNARNRADATD